jgi:hypothetical protein
VRLALYSIAVFLAFSALDPACAWDGPSPEGKAAAEPKAAKEETPETTKQQNAAPEKLGEAGQRNENVAVYLIDTNAIKEANVRVGTSPTLIREPAAGTQYWAAEHGRPAGESLMLKAAPSPAGWHGDAFWWHQNSAMNARTFFQVGGVMPSHRNVYGGRFTGALGHFGFLSGSFQQRNIQGMVNGNVLVPLESERTPLTKDPEAAALIQKYLNAYPAMLPNRTDFDPRALNTNAPQQINQVAGSARLDLNTGSKGRLFLGYGIDRQRIDAFQLVAGQNPDTEIHTQFAKATWQYSMDALTQLQIGASYSRNHSALLSEPNAVGPRLRFGYQIEELGPDSMFPANRATNTFRYGAAFSRIVQGGRHQLAAGGDWVRFQLNGIESLNSRGLFQFGNNFGRSAIDNLRWGTPNLYEVAVGELDRGFRNWTATAYFGDKWNVNSRLQLYLGLMYMADSSPVEVHNLEQIPYSTDANNFGPRLGLAWKVGRGWVARAMYTVSYAPIPAVSYQQIRMNPPNVYYLMIPDPDLVHPLKGVDLTNPTLRYSPTWFSPDMVSAYSHQYGVGLEKTIFSNLVLRLNYIGSHSLKLMNIYTVNRAEPVDGIPFTTRTVDARRPDARYSDEKLILNGGIAYFDAGQVAWDWRYRSSLTISTSYTFSKAIDEGVDFSSTAANRDLTLFRSQYQYDSLRDRKGLSNFDSPHSFYVSYNYRVPSAREGPEWLRTLLANWQVAGVNMWKMGTPMTFYVGSDGPGFGNVDGGGGDRPNIVDPSILGRTIGNPDTAPDILRRDRFSYIVPGQRAGNLGRGTFRKSAIWNWNAAVSRQFRLPNEWNAQLRAEVYNLTNTPQFDEPQRNLSSPSFGKITNTLNDGRVFQLGFRVTF